METEIPEKDKLIIFYYTFPRIITCISDVEAGRWSYLLPDVLYQ